MLGVGLGGSAIAATKIASNITEEFIDKHSNNFIVNIEDILEGLNFTGNNAIDMLLLIQNFQRIQIILLFILGYNLLILWINETNLEAKLLKLMRLSIVNFILNTIKKIKKFSKVFIFASFVLLVISPQQAFHYLDFYLENIEKIINLYFK